MTYRRRILQNRVLVLGMVLVLTTALSARALAIAPASSLAGSTFQIDGNLMLDSEPGAKDWENAPSLAKGFDKPTGQGDDSFGEGSKEDSPVPSVVSGSIPNNKSDLTRFYVSHEKNSAGKDFLYLAWERVQEPKGTTNMDFEFNQSRTVSSNGTTPVRQAGDILIKYDLDSGGTNPSLGYHVWVTSGVPKQVCEASSSVPCWGKGQPLSGYFSGAVNTVLVSDPIPPGAPRNLDPWTFGEAAINLTDSGIFQPNQCTSFGSAYLKSRSSSSFTAAIKDFISPISVEVNSCAGLSIHKQDDAGTALQGWTFTLYSDNSPTGGSRGNEDTATSFSCTTGASGDCSIPANTIPFGEYWVVETPKAGYTTASDQHVSLGPSSNDVKLTFVNSSTIKVIVLVCQESDNSLLASSVSVDSGNTWTTVGKSGGGTMSDASLCGLTGAGGKSNGSHTANITVP